MYSWGSAINGELGLGGLEDAQVNIPSRVPFNSSARLAIITSSPLWNIRRSIDKLALLWGEAQKKNAYSYLKVT